MKIKLFFTFTLIVANFQLNGQNQSKVYDFPIRPGTQQWQNLNSYDEKLNAYNIPETLLKNMNTSDLVQTCLNYPEFRLIMTRNSLQQGYDYIKSIFNGFRELEKRSDAGKELIEQYKNLYPSDIKKFDTPVKRGGFAFKLTYIEIMLAQKPILLTLDVNSKKELIKAGISNFEMIEKMPENYGTFGLITPALVLGRLLETNNLAEFSTKISADSKLRWFVDKSIVDDTATLTYIVTNSKTYLKQLENE